MYTDFLIRIVPAVITALLLCYVAMPAIIRIASMKKLIDEPKADRKFHGNIVPTLGGIGIFSAFLISYSIWGNASQLESYPFFVAGLFMLFLVGIKDDILMISPLNKLIFQLLAAIEIVFGGGIVLTDFGGILGIHEIPWIIGAIVTIFIFVALINSYNLIDGIDGLAGGIGVVISGIIGIWFWSAGFITLAVLSLTLMGALIGFLVYNVYPAKIFMGDTGSMAVGFILAYLTVQFLIYNNSVAGSSLHVENAHIFAVALLIIPIVDTLRVFFLRILSGKSPFKADHNHTHHKLLDMNIPQHYAAFLLWSANFLIIAFAYYFQSMETNTLLFWTLLSGFMILPVTRVVCTHLLGLAGKKEKWEPVIRFSSNGYNGRGGDKEKGKSITNKLEEHFFPSE